MIYILSSCLPTHPPFLLVCAQYELVVITGEGVEIVGPITQDTNWNIAHYVK